MYKKNVICLAVLILTSLTYAFTGGDGTAENPYQISTEAVISESEDNIDSYSVMTHESEILFYEDFESVNSEWTIENGIWQIGVPSSGGTRSGTNVAATNLTGVYPANSDSRLISPAIGLPGILSDERIELRFWQWYESHGGDVGYVQISVLHEDSTWGVWQTVAEPGGYYHQYWTSGWSRVAVDLTSYTSQTIRIAFYHTAQDVWSGADEGLGWYLDDIEIWRGVPQMPVLEDFESGWGDWSTDSGIWQIGVPSSGGTRSGTNVAATNLTGVYPANSDSRLISPPIQLPYISLSDTILFRFWQWYSYRNHYGDVQISVMNPDRTWENWITLGRSAFENQSSGWSLQWYDLTEYSGHLVRIGFNHIAGGTTGPGWYIDDVHLNTFSPSALTVGQEYSGSLSGTGDRDYFVVQVPPGGHLRVTLEGLDGLGSNQIYLRHGALPSTGTYDYKYSVNGQASHEVFVPSAKPGYWYILVSSNNVAGDGAYTLKVDYYTGVFLDRMTPGQHGNVPNTILTLFGAGFAPGAKVDLMQDGLIFLSSQQTDFISGTQLSSTFDFAAVDPDDYQIRVTVEGKFDELPFRLVQAIGPKLETNLIVPSSVGYHQPATIWVEYANTGDTAMPAPLLVIGARQSGYERAILRAPYYIPLSGVWEAPAPRSFWTHAMPEGFSNTVQILASGSTAGLLQPGEKKKVPIQWAGWQQPWNFAYPPITFTLGTVQATNTEPVNWQEMKTTMQPDSIPVDTWEALWRNFRSGVGATWGDYVRMLHKNARYLGNLGMYVNDVGKLLAFEFAQADGLNIVRTLSSATDAHVPAPGLDISFSRMYGQNISSRYRQGILGRGWSHNWDYWLEFVADGTIKMHTPGGGARIYQPDSRPRRPYFSMEGDYAVFAAITGGYSHTEANGLLRVFTAAGKLSYVQDTNGNRLTCTYSGDYLTRIEHTSGKSLDFGYHLNGLLEAVIDPVGRQTTYIYDISNQYLVDVTYFDNKSVQYAYDTGDNVSILHALISIAYPGGSHQYFDYTASGKLASMYKDNLEEKFDFTYDSAGMVSVGCACTGGTKSRYYLDHQGMLAKSVNPLNEGVFLKYDSDYNLTSVIDPTGRSYNYTYNDKGNLVHISDPLGNGTRLGYLGTFNRLTTLVDANGNFTQYDYDGSGNLESITYNDDSVESWIYDEKGNPIVWTNRRGSSIEYEYDADGRITAKIYPDSSVVAYDYDERGNLISAVDANGTTSFEYDAHDQLIKITYPQNRWLQYSYNAAGQRAAMTNQLGHSLAYYYDAVGRLESISDQTANEIVHYYYDQAGRLEQKVLGNGVYTTYTYDPAGRLESLTNYKSDTTILSGFAYTYDSRGRRISMTTTYGQPGDVRNAYEGQWLYEYDDLGQLTAWTDPTGRRVEYAYDALGNRITETDNGSAISYTTNALNQYTQRGNTTYQYDADGSLIKEIGTQGTTNYTYNHENKLIAVSSPQGNWLYTYDAFGNRIRVDDNGTLTDYVIDPIGFGNVVGEYDNPTGDWVLSYDHGLGLLTRDNPLTGVAYYSFDAIGNTQELTNPAQQILNNYIYEPFGKDMLSNEAVYNPFKFVGQFGVMKETNGLDFMRARFYESGMGRFINPDPIGLLGGDKNLYRYTSNDPILKIDPIGLQEYIRKTTSRTTKTISTKGGKTSVIVQETTLEIEETSSGGTDYDTAINHSKSTTESWRRVHKQIGEVAEKNIYVDGALKAMDIVISSGEVGHKAGPHGTQMFLEKDPTKVEGHVKYFYWEIIREAMSKGFPGGDTAIKILEWIADLVRPQDPNLKYGPKGYGEQNFVPLNSVLPYKIDFENDPNATAPAQVVEISDPQHEALDWMSFELTEIGFGDIIISIPEGSQHFEKKVPFSFNGVDFDVEIEAGIDLSTGEVYAFFYSVVSWTGLPPAVGIGFLPPEDGTGRGMGYVNYNIKAKPDLATGTELRNIAYITFDFLETIATNQIDPHDPSAGTDPDLECLITIDAGLPDSYIEPLPAESLSPFMLYMTGQDDQGGSGLGSFDIYASTNGAPFVLWKTTPDNSIEFDGEVGSTYAFYSIARDNAGNYEDRPQIADTSTTVVEKHLMISSWNLVGYVRVGRTSFDYTFSVSLQNTRNHDSSNIAMSVHPYEGNVTLIDGEINISLIPANSTLTASDTITLRVDYTQPTPAIKLAGQIVFDSDGQMGQIQNLISYLLIGTNRDIGDINGDGTVDMQDLMLLTNDWLSGNSLADITPPPNGDGIVNIEDFAVIADNWLITVDK